MNPQTVQIVVEAQNWIVVHLEPAHVSKQAQNEVIWRGNKDFKVFFEKSPFAKYPGPEEFSGGPGQEVHSGPANQNATEGTYKYGVTSPGCDPLDPGVVIVR